MSKIDLSKYGKKISASEIAQIYSKYGEEGVKKAEKSGDMKPGAVDWWAQNQPGVTVADPAPEQGIYTAGTNIGNYSIPAGRYSEQEYDYLAKSGLTNLQGQIDVEKIQARGLVDTKIATTQAETTRYGYDLDLAARKYIADQDLLKGTRMAEIQAAASNYASDRELEARKYIQDQTTIRETALEGMRGQNRIDLQNIIDAGLENIQSMRGQTERDVATLQGEYGIKQESERQRGQKEIAEIGSESSFRNALIGAFSF